MSSVSDLGPREGSRPPGWVYALVGVVVVAAGLLFTLSLLAVAQGTSIDPTELSFGVRLHNDTTGTVVLKQCDATCGSFHEVDRLLPGGNVPVNFSSDGGITNLWAVTDAQGAVLGCLSRTYDHKVSDLIVQVSSYAPCPQ
jgi:hypothetical protein